MTGAALDALRAAVGAAQVLTDGDLSAYEVDWRKRYRGRALAVVRPGSTAEVAAVVRVCIEHGLPIVPPTVAPIWDVGIAPIGQWQVQLIDGPGSEFDAVIQRVRAGKFKPEDYASLSLMRAKGASLSPLGTFEGKVPPALVSQVRAKEADILSGRFQVPYIEALDMTMS